MRYIISATLLALLPTGASPVTPRCESILDVVSADVRAHNERRAYDARTASGAAVRIWVNEDTGTWRLVFLNGETCEAWRGDKWTAVAPGAPL